MKPTVDNVRAIIATIREPFTFDDVAVKLPVDDAAERDGVRSIVFYLAEQGELDKRASPKGMKRQARFTRKENFVAVKPAGPTAYDMQMRAEGVSLLQSIAVNWGARRYAIAATETPEDHAGI